MRRAPLASIAVMLCCVASHSCAPGFRLVDEQSQSPFGPLARTHEALLETARFYTWQFPDGWPVHARMLSSPSGGADERPVLVLLNGVFSDGDTWRFVTGPLSEDVDLLVMDLPGTGLSCGTEPDALPRDSFTQQWIAARVWAALARWQAEQPAPRRLVLVGHSLAGSVILRMLGDPGLRRSMPVRSFVDAAVLIDAADVGTDAWSPVLVELATLSEPEVEIGGALGVLEHEVGAGVARSVARPERAFQREATRMIEALEDRDARRASQLMLQRIRPLDAAEEPRWPLVHLLSGDHARVDVPVLLLWGREDDILPLSTAEKLEREIPGARLAIIDGAKHSVHQEAPLDVASRILRFLAP